MSQAGFIGLRPIFSLLIPPANIVTVLPEIGNPDESYVTTLANMDCHGVMNAVFTSSKEQDLISTRKHKLSWDCECSTFTISRRTLCPLVNKNRQEINEALARS
ncbi:hypothetical protein CEXT_641431 [Caerostris extrusa]|uniref:Uncharacterized protein n=1 Tax=Caerostris extrusa TaxID=172846 RepID=A0AAV4SPF7_CAEEX|nr:hypothetical protein CEXT_641431 [Caerostris extrusa]